MDPHDDAAISGTSGGSSLSGLSLLVAAGDCKGWEELSTRKGVGCIECYLRLGEVEHRLNPPGTAPYHIFEGVAFYQVG